ncbi:hypothetical protein Bbelb_073020 [Branchiostoma belcheri]|nr:hypothetical protein Bbelb_073020 [Branchiostoma belcheri]
MFVEGVGGKRSPVRLAEKAVQSNLGMEKAVRCFFHPQIGLDCFFRQSDWTPFSTNPCGSRPAPSKAQSKVTARQPLPAGLKLAITLRFLATGNSYRSLEFPLRVAHMQHNITVLKYMYAGLSSRLFSTAHWHSDTQAGACSAARRVPGSEVTASLRRISPNGARSDFNSELKSIRRPRGAKIGRQPSGSPPVSVQVPFGSAKKHAEHAPSGPLS